MSNICPNCLQYIRTPLVVTNPKDECLPSQAGKDDRGHLLTCKYQDHHAQRRQK